MSENNRRFEQRNYGHPTELEPLSGRELPKKRMARRRNRAGLVELCKTTPAMLTLRAEESCNADGGPEPSAAGSEGGNPVLGSVLWCWEPGVPRVARGTPRLFTGRPYGMGACLESGRG
jgi:hypothetical protein